MSKSTFHRYMPTGRACAKAMPAVVVVGGFAALLLPTSQQMRFVHTGLNFTYMALWLVVVIQLSALAFGMRGKRVRHNEGRRLPRLGRVVLFECLLTAVLFAYYHGIAVI